MEFVGDVKNEKAMKGDKGKEKDIWRVEDMV